MPDIARYPRQVPLFLSDSHRIAPSQKSLAADGEFLSNRTELKGMIGMCQQYLPAGRSAMRRRNIANDWLAAGNFQRMVKTIHEYID
jgi:hypothetical protein